MPSRQDQLHSYQFSVQRVVAALVTHETDPPQSPFRRAAGAALASVLVAAIAVGGFALYGLFTGQRGADLRDPTAIFVEKETGARFVYYQPDDRLHPVLNYASARLILGSAQARTVTMARSALARLPLGAPLGIAGAPDSLPGPRELVTTGWTLCGQVAAGAAAPTSTLLIGAGVTGGYPVAVPGAGASADAVLAAAADGRVHLLYANRRFLVPQPRPVLAAFGWSDRQPVRLAPAVLNAVPAGGDLRAPAIARLGEPSAALPVKIGQLYRAPARSGGFQSAIALADGVADLTEVQAQLVGADPTIAARVGQQPITLGIAQYGDLPRSRAGLGAASGPDALPASVPNLVNVSRSVCVRVGGAAEPVSAVLVDATIPGAAGAGAVPGAAAAAPVERVSVPRGRGVLVEAAASPGAPRGTGTVSVVTDAGVRYPLVNSDVAAMLGYGQVVPQQMPAEVVALLPAGPALDPAAATTVGR